MLGFKIKANPETALHKVKEYVFKPPKEGSKSGVWNSIEMLVNYRRMDAAKFGDELVENSAGIFSTGID